MRTVWGDMRPVAAAAMWLACTAAQTASAAEAHLPETTVQEQGEAFQAGQATYATEVLTLPALERQQVLDIRDATRDMVNVEVPRTARRGTGVGGVAGREGNTGFEIRGLGGNRVQTLVDGIPQPEADSFMNSHSFGRDYVDPLTLAGIEVHKGASEVHVPSGGIAGAVNMRTLSPYDLLGAHKDFAGRALLGWRSESQGTTLGLALAGKASPQLQWLLAVNGDWSDETSTMGQVGGTGLKRTKANPEDNRRQSVLAKLVLTPGAGHKHVLTLESRRQTGDINNLHDFNNGSTLSHTEATKSTRTRLSLRSDIVLGHALADDIRSYLAWQDSSNQQELVLETRTANGTRMRDHAYDERLLQAGVQAHKSLGAHALQYGFDILHSDSDTDSIQSDNGVRTQVPKGPDTRSLRWGLFVKDSFALADWTIQPGLRWESIKISPDAGSVATNPLSGADMTAQRFSGWMPQLGAKRALAGDVQLFANYQRGFRAPTSSEMYNYFGNITPYYGYFILPNPDLKAETSNHFELGLRDAEGAVQWEATVFYGRYRNFIERYAAAGNLPSRPSVTLQQSRNQRKATIQGVELRGKTEVGHALGGKWSVRAGYSYTKGSGEDGQGLESIAPQQLKLALGHTAATWNWELAATHNAAKKRRDVSASSTAAFFSPSHTVWDVSGQMQLRKGLRLNVGLFNLTDKKYWNWSDVRGVTSAAEVAAIDAYSQPGRNVRVSLVADF